MNRKSYDVVIAGAGTAGTTLAYLLAKDGFEVALIDRRYKELIGDKICGDAIAAHHFKSANVPKPSKDVIRVWVEGFKVYPRSMDYNLKIVAEDGGYIVDRHRYGQELLYHAIKEGVDLYDGIIANNLIIDDDYAKGIVGYKVGSNGVIKVYGKIIVDATGYPAALLMKAPDKWLIDKRVRSRDIIIAYREIVEVDKPIWDMENLHLHFISKYAPTGYVWIFPWDKDGKKLNFGNGMIPGVSSYKPHELLNMYANEVIPEYLANRRILKKGSWNIPNRRPRYNFVGNGFLAVGDSAIMINPATAEGIGYGLYGAWVASKHIKKALEAGDYSRDALWGYQREYVTSSYGIRQARLDVFKYILQAYSDLDYEFVIKHRILTSSDMIKARDEDSFLSSFDKAVRVIKATLHGKLKIVKDLKYVIDVMRLVKNIYLEYPTSIEGLMPWIRKVENIFSELDKRFPPYKPQYI